MQTKTFPTAWILSACSGKDGKQDPDLDTFLGVPTCAGSWGPPDNCTQGWNQPPFLLWLCLEGGMAAGLARVAEQQLLFLLDILFLHWEPLKCVTSSGQL